MRISVICEGRTRDAHLRALQADYAGRIAHFSDFSVTELPPSKTWTRGKTPKLTPKEQQLLKKLGRAVKVLLDPAGNEWTSQEFAEWMGKQALHGAREFAFLVGGPDGFPDELAGHVDLKLSLSRMTLTHDWARVLLLEQIYRGFTILRGYPYQH
jgi:23S rRNA (pseudouridine1915-N3)-methyltransferase